MLQGLPALLGNQLVITMLAQLACNVSRQGQWCGLVLMTISSMISCCTACLHRQAISWSPICLKSLLQGQTDGSVLMRICSGVRCCSPCLHCWATNWSPFCQNSLSSLYQGGPVGTGRSGQAVQVQRGIVNCQAQQVGTVAASPTVESWHNLTVQDSFDVLTVPQWDQMLQCLPAVLSNQLVTSLLEQLAYNVSRQHN